MDKSAKGRAYVSLVSGLGLTLIGALWIGPHWLPWALFALGIAVYYGYKLVTA